MTTLFRRVFLTDSQRKRAQSADLLVSGGTIERIAPSGSLEISPHIDVFDGRGQTALMPGLINGHSHLAMTLVRGLGEDLSLMDWLEECIWPAEANLTPELIETGALAGIAEGLKAGQTAFIDMYFHMDRVLTAAQRMGVRAGLAETIFAGPNRDEALDAVDCLAGLCGQNSSMYKAFYGPHAPYTTDRATMDLIGERALATGRPVHVHFLETQEERRALEKDGAPLDWLCQSGLDQTSGLILAHGVWLTEGEMDQLASWGNVTVSHCPSSNLKLGDGFARLAEMTARGLNTSLGADGPASNNRIDPWGEMRLAYLLQKGLGHQTDYAALSALESATLGGARALGFEKLGLIQEGWAADLVAVDLTGLHYSGINEDNLAAWLVCAGSSADVKVVMVAGRWVWKDGQFADETPAGIRTQLDEARRALLSSRRV